MRNIAILIILISSSTMIIAQNYGSWTEIDSMNIARVGHAMVVLPNGNVLVSGGEVDSIQSSCEIYEINTGKWRYTKPMNVPRVSHNMVLLNTGKVLAIGGYKEQSCELFDSITESWTMTDSIPTFRFNGQTVTKLSDGRIMVAGGYYVDTTSWDFIILNKVDIYNPVTETWIEATPMNLGRKDHRATLLNNGRVLITGGQTENLHTDQCEVYDPLNNTWSDTTPMIEKRWSHASILLNNGNVFVSGGNPIAPWLKSCEIFDINTGLWYAAADMLAYRTDHRIYYLSKIDKLLIIGGDAQPITSEDTWEIYDPNTLAPLYIESFPVNQFLVGNNVQLLSEKIMVAGGEEYDFNPMPYSWPSKRCWIYDAATEVAQDNKVTEEFFLSQNYPNPFNPVTTISYNLVKPAQVKLVVYDVMGREVTTLVEENQSAGKFNKIFDASNLSSGIYYYRITINNAEKGNRKTFQQTKKMVLIR